MAQGEGNGDALGELELELQPEALDVPVPCISEADPLPLWVGLPPGLRDAEGEALAWAEAEGERDPPVLAVAAPLLQPLTLAHAEAQELGEAFGGAVA